MTAVAGIIAAVIAYWLICRLKRPLLQYSAAILFPVLAALLLRSWHCLGLCPLLLLPLWLKLPQRPLESIPKMAFAKAALIPEEALTQGAPQAVTLCVPFQAEDAAQRRRGGNVLFNTAVTLCANELADSQGLLSYAAAQGFDPQRLSARMPRQAILNPESDNLLRIAHQDASALRWFIAGDPRQLLPRCTQVLDGKLRSISYAEHHQLLAVCDQLHAAGQTLYAFACADSAEGSYTYLGSIGLRPLLKPAMPAQIRRLFHLGAQPVLWSRSFPERAWALARESGFIRADDYLVTGTDIHSMSDDELAHQVKCIRVCHGIDRSARRRLVHAWKQNGENLITLSAEGLTEWESALQRRQALETQAAQLKQMVPWLTYLPCAGVALGSFLNGCMITLVSVLVGAAAWFLALRKASQASTNV